MVSKELMDVLACPICKGDIELKGKFIVCRKCKKAFPVLDDVPDMLIEDAWPLDKAEKGRFTHKLKL